MEKATTPTNTTDNAATINKKKTKTAKRRKVLKYYNVDRLGDLKVSEYFFWRGIWKKVQFADDADLLFHIFEDNIDWSWVKEKMVNKVPGVTQLSTKQQHAYVFKKFSQYHDDPMKELGFPETFLLPYEYKQYLQAHNARKKSVYLTKQNTGSQGTGIVLILNPSQLMLSSEDLIVQKYISNPYLVRGLKHDMRVYVTITSVEPLKAFINMDGLVRFCTEPYQAPNSENRIKGTMHLSNYSLNKNSEAYVFTDSIEEVTDGSKQLLSAYLKTYPDPEGFWEKLISMVNHSLVALHPFLRYFLKCAYPKGDQGKMFHIIGYDVMIDDKGDLHLIELNANPSMNVQFEGNDEVKEKIKTDVKSGNDGSTVKVDAKDKTASAAAKREADKAKAALKPRLAFGSAVSVPRKPREVSVDKKTDADVGSKVKKPRVPKKLSPQQSLQEIVEEVEEDNPLNARLQKYKKFRDYEFSRNEARKNPTDLDPICFVDLHVKSQ